MFSKAAKLLARLELVNRVIFCFLHLSRKRTWEELALIPKHLYPSAFFTGDFGPLAWATDSAYEPPLWTGASTDHLQWQVWVTNLKAKGVMSSGHICEAPSRGLKTGSVVTTLAFLTLDIYKSVFKSGQTARPSWTRQSGHLLFSSTLSETHLGGVGPYTQTLFTIKGYNC